MTRKILTRSLIAIAFGTALVAASGVATGAKADTARAEFQLVHDGGHGGYRNSKRRVRRMLRRNGYRHIYSIRYLEGPGLYVAKGKRRHGRHYRVFVNPRTGYISHRWPRRHRRGWDRGWDRGGPWNGWGWGWNGPRGGHGGHNHRH